MKIKLYSYNEKRYLKRLLGLFAVVAVTILILNVYRVITWDLGLLFNEKQVKNGWFLFVPFLPNEINWSKLKNIFIETSYPMMEFFMLLTPILIYTLFGWKKYKWFLIATFILFTLHGMFYILLPTYIFTNQRPEIIPGDWHWSCFPSYHNQSNTLALVSLFILFFSKKNYSQYKYIYIFIAYLIFWYGWHYLENIKINTIMQLFRKIKICVLKLPFGNAEITFVHLFKTIFLFSFIFVSAYFAKEDNSLFANYNLQKANKYNYNIVYFIMLAFIFVVWIFTWITSFLIRDVHYAVDGLASFALAVLVYWTCSKVYLPRIKNEPLVYLDIKIKRSNLLFIIILIVLGLTSGIYNVVCGQFETAILNQR